MSVFTATVAVELFRRLPRRRCRGSRLPTGGPGSRRVVRARLAGQRGDLPYPPPHLVDRVTCHLIDLPGARSSRFGPDTPITVARHIESVRRVVDLLDVDDLAVVGHNSGGMIARHATVDHPRLRAMGLINTETSGRHGWRFRSFIAAGKLPGFSPALGWLVGRPRLRRNEFVLGGAFADRSLLDGEFDEFFLRPLRQQPDRLDAAMKVLRSFDLQHIRDLTAIHRRLTVPVKLVWGEEDPFFPVAAARDMAATFPDARLTVVEGAGLFAHEERPKAVAEALLPALTVDGPSDEQ